MSIYEVARVAGVSKSTVSRHINGLPGVSVAAAKSIHEAMRALGYRPSEARPGPKSSRFISYHSLGRPNKVVTGCVALVNVARAAPQLDHPYFNRLRAALQRVLAGLEMSLVLDDVNPTGAPLCVRESRVDGVLLTGFPPSRDLITNLGKCPVVFLSGGADTELLCDHVLADNPSVGIMAANYLVDRGRRKLAFVNASPVGNSSNSRQRSFTDRTTELGLEVQSFVTQAHRPGHDDWATGTVRARILEQVERMLAGKIIPDGVFLPYDQHAAAFQQLMAERGVRAGHGDDKVDMEIISVGNEDTYRGGMFSRSATIDPNPTEIGRWGIERLVARMNGETAPPVRIMVTPTLLADRGRRESSAN